MRVKFHLIHFWCLGPPRRDIVLAARRGAKQDRWQKVVLLRTVGLMLDTVGVRVALSRAAEIELYTRIASDTGAIRSRIC
jgi:hypothetical protein